MIHEDKLPQIPPLWVTKINY